MTQDLRAALRALLQLRFKIYSTPLAEMLPIRNSDTQGRLESLLTYLFGMNPSPPFAWC